MDEHPLELTAWVADSAQRLGGLTRIVTSPVVPGLPRTIRSGAGVDRGQAGRTTTVPAILSCHPCLRRSNPTQITPRNRITKLMIRPT